MFEHIFRAWALRAALKQVRAGGGASIAEKFLTGIP